MTINRRNFVIGSTTGLLSLGLNNISWALDGHKNAATGKIYKKKNKINGGKPIKLEYWEWSSQRAEYQRNWIKAYTAMYPNVEIEMVLQPWKNYWPAITTNVPAGEGPALWHMHTSKLTEFCEGNLMAPMPDFVADQNHLNNRWVGFAEGAMDCPLTKGRHFLPMGAMLPLLLINTDKWNSAGLTQDDIPKTWDQFRNVAK